MTDAQHEDLSFTNLEELEGLASKTMLKQSFDYYKCGAHSEATLGFNRASFHKFKILPRILVDVSKVDTSTQFLGNRLNWPIMIAPMAMQRLAHEDGELAVARACGEHDIGLIHSTNSTVHMTKVARTGKQCGVPLLLFQLYVITDREFTRKLVKDAEEAGYSGLVITVDAPKPGRKESDEKNNFHLPEGMELENLHGLSGKGRQEQISSNGSALANLFASFYDPSLTWDFIASVRSMTSLPIILKGLLAVVDAELAVKAGVDAIIVSNHGGRQLDFAPSALEVLPQIAATVNKQIPVWIDGGVRRGTDVIKALALGASGVLLGRPVVYALAIGGQAGVERALSILKQELKLSLQLMGCPSIQQLTPRNLLTESSRL